MDRRQIISAAALAAMGAITLAPRRSRAAETAASPPAEGYVAAKDGTSLFVRDWGAGSPVLFLSGWALPSR